LHFWGSVELNIFRLIKILKIDTIQSGGMFMVRIFVNMLVLTAFLVAPLSPMLAIGAAWADLESMNPFSYVEQDILHASDMQPGDTFGRDLALDGDVLVVGARYEDGGPGSPESNAGAAYVFVRDPGDNTWNQVKILHASDPQVNDNFGLSVAISGDTIIVGSYMEDGGPGDPRFASGAAYIFERNQGGPDNWGQVKILRASDSQTYDYFGRYVAIDGDTIVVGAYSESGGPGDPLPDAGAVYIFERNQGGSENWGEVRILHASDAQAYDWFGESVSIDADTVVVGGRYEDGGKGDPATDCGAAYVYERNQGGSDNWGEVAILHASDRQPADYFGHTLEINADTVIVSAFFEDGGPGDPAPDAGAAYIFERNQGGANNWGEAAILHASDLEAVDRYGFGVAVSDNIAVVGAYLEDGGLGSPLPDSGAAYVYLRNWGGPGQWGELDKITASDAEANDNFGIAILIEGLTVAVGSLYEDGGPGNPQTDAGAAYMYTLIVLPEAVDDAFEVVEDNPKNPLAVLTNDSDPDLGPLAIVDVGTLDQGGSVIFSHTVITYTPASDFSGFETFAYTITNEMGYQDSALVTVAVTPVNDAPIAFGDNYTATEDIPLIVAAPGLLTNDMDIDNDPLTSTLTTGPEHGLLALNPDGSFTYTPSLNYASVDYFTYQLADAILTDTTLVTLTILPVNDMPDAAGDSYTTTENMPLVVTAPGLLLNDSDVDGDVLTATLASCPADGTLTLNEDGSFVYTPDAHYSGSDSFNYRANDSWYDSKVVSVTITVLPGVYRIYLPVAVQRH
jgi:hypothetical protein